MSAPILPAWTPEENAKLRELWAEGMSASKIADHFPGKTRNAVIGRAHRLGLAGRPSPIKHEETAIGPPRPLKLRRKASKTMHFRGGPPHVARLMSAAISKQLREGEAEASPVEVRTENKDALLQSLEANGRFRHASEFTTCQWIEGEGPPYRNLPVCGDKTAHPTIPYCLDHARRCYIVREHREKLYDNA